MKCTCEQRDRGVSFLENGRSSECFTRTRCLVAMGSHSRHSSMEQPLTVPMCPIKAQSQSRISLHHARGFRLKTTQRLLLVPDLREPDIHPVDQRRLIANWAAFAFYACSYI